MTQASFSRSLSRCKFIPGTVLFCILFVSTFAGAQTRAAQLAALQAEKSKQVRPYKPNRAEDLIIKVQKWGLVSQVPRGLYPYIGSAFPGGGLAIGAGYRKPFADTGSFDIHGAWSISNYKLLSARLRFPDMAAGRLSSLLHAKYQDANKVAFFGIGNDTEESDETNFAYTPKRFGIQEVFDITHSLHVGGDFSYEDYETGLGESTRVPPIEAEFSPAQVPGLGLDFQYLTGNVFAEFDWRESPGYTTSGGLYRVDWFNYSQRDGSGFDFRRVDVELVQHLPILRGNQILAFRGLASFTDTDDPEQIPFFLLPKLGGGSELRGFRDFRFRDKHRMLLTAEYRWTPSKFMDMVLFYETGKVAAEKEDLDLNDLHDCYGIGARFHAPGATALRIELARSNEGMRIIFSGGPAF